MTYAFNTNTFNANSLNSTPSYAFISLSTDAQNLCSIANSVGIGTASQNILSLVQDVYKYTSTASQNICSIEQHVKNYGISKNICSISNYVYNPAAGSTFFDRNGYRIQLVLGGYEVPEANICAMITCTKEENSNNLLEFSLRVSNPIEFINFFWGKSVTLAHITSSVYTLLFTGKIDTPQVDLINKVIKFSCSNHRNEIINNTYPNLPKQYGLYTEQVLGKFDTAAQELALRMQTVAASFDLDANNVPALNSWYAKASPDYTLSGSDVYYRDPRVIWQDRAKVVNDITYTFAYKYTRLYHTEQAFSWAQPSFAESAKNGYTLPTTAMIESAIASTKWKLDNTVSYTAEWPADYVTVIYGGVPLASMYNPYTNQLSLKQPYTYLPKIDQFGNQITDSSGNYVYKQVANSQSKAQSTVYTTAASWQMSFRSSQIVQETYSLNVKSSQSITQFGSVIDKQSSTYTDNFDASAWEAYAFKTAQPSNAVSSGAGYYYNNDTNPDIMKNSLACAIAKCQTDILKTHRDTAVIFETTLLPSVELSHTLKVDTSKVLAKGKVAKIVHRIDVTEGKDASTEITIKMFRSTSSATTSNVAIPARPTDTIAITMPTVTLGNYYTTDNYLQTIANGGQWTWNTAYNGHLGNKFIPVTYTRSYYIVIHTISLTAAKEEFRVDTTDVPDIIRSQRELTASSTYDTAIPNDLLEVYF